MYMYFSPSDILVAKQNQGRQRLQGGFGEWGTNILDSNAPNGRASVRLSLKFDGLPFNTLYSETYILAPENRVSQKGTF